MRQSEKKTPIRNYITNTTLRTHHDTTALRTSVRNVTEGTYRRHWNSIEIQLQHSLKSFQKRILGSISQVIRFLFVGTRRPIHMLNERVHLIGEAIVHRVIIKCGHNYVLQPHVPREGFGCTALYAYVRVYNYAGTCVPTHDIARQQQRRRLSTKSACIRKAEKNAIQKDTSHGTTAA
jgi:hypothetical protein